MVAHQGQREEHLTGEPSNESGREAHETVRLDQLIEIDTK